jgi:hypothetical protein
MGRLYIFTICLLIISCNDNGCSIRKSAFEEKFTPVGVNVNMTEVLAKRNGLLLPNSCNIVSLTDIADALNVQESMLEVTDSSPRGSNATHSSCFFKWPDDEIGNAGILFQAMRNPMEDEIPNYIELFIESKRTSGEQGVGEAPDIFKTLEGLGDDGAYSTEAGKYFWRLGDQIIFSIAFNSPHSPEEQFRIARKLGVLMTQNYIDGK